MTSSSDPRRDGAEAAFRRGKRQDAEVEAALQHLDADLPRGHAADVDLDARELPAEVLEERQQDVDRRFVGADQHAPPLQIAQVADRGIRLLRQPHQPLRVVEEHASGLGELAVLRRPVEQALAEVVLETLDGLADGRLRPVQPGRSPGKASLRGDRQKDLQLSQIHGSSAF